MKNFTAIAPPTIWHNFNVTNYQQMIVISFFVSEIDPDILINVAQDCMILSLFGQSRFCLIFIFHQN